MCACSNGSSVPNLLGVVNHPGTPSLGRAYIGEKGGRFYATIRHPKTRVFTSRGQLPVEDAAVSIVQHGQDGRQHLLNIQSSDRSGNTLPTVIETPDAWESQSPGQEAPFSLCDVWVECPGYQLLLVQNVQIFSGVTSIQDLPLIPLAEATGRPASRVDITPQNL